MNGDIALPAALRNDTSALRGRIEDFLYLEAELLDSHAVFHHDPVARERGRAGVASATRAQLDAKCKCRHLRRRCGRAAGRLA